MSRTVIDPSNYKAFTEEEFFAAFEEDLGKLIQWLECLFGKQAVKSMIDPEAMKTPKDIIATPLGTEAWKAYWYAEHGEFIDGWHLWGLDQLLLVICPLAELIRSVDDMLSDELAQVARKLYARAKVDRYRDWGDKKQADKFDTWWISWDEGITIEDVAVICNMSVSSVRNHTTAKAKDRLLTYKENNRTWIEPDSLFDWLTRRRGYKPSKIVEIDCPEPSYFTDREGLNDYIYTVIRNQNISSESIADIVQLPEEELGAYTTLGMLNFDWTMERVVRFAKAADLIDSGFIERANQILLSDLLQSEGIGKQAEVINFPGVQNEKL